MSEIRITSFPYLVVGILVSAVLNVILAVDLRQTNERLAQSYSDLFAEARNALDQGCKPTSGFRFYQFEIPSEHEIHPDRLKL